MSDESGKYFHPTITLRFNKSGFEQVEPSSVSFSADWRQGADDKRSYLLPSDRTRFLKMAIASLVEKLIEENTFD